MGAGFSAAAGKVDKIVDPRLQRMAEIIRNRARSRIHHRSGRLGQSGKVTKLGMLLYEVRFEAFNKGFNYAGAVEFGRGPVRPIRAKFLAIPFAGGIVFSKYARAAPAQHFLGNAIDESAGAINARIGEIEKDLAAMIEASI